jgi:hypothetical protein
MNFIPNAAMTQNPSAQGCSSPMNKKRRLLIGGRDVVATSGSAKSPTVRPSSPAVGLRQHHHHHHRLKHKKDVSSEGDAILASMTNVHLRSADKFVVACTMTMLATIFEEKEEYRSLACHELGTRFSIVHAMKTHADCPRIQCLGCQSLSSLLLCRSCTDTETAGDDDDDDNNNNSNNNDNNSSHAIGEIEVVLSAMLQFTHDAEIQVAASTYLGRLLLCSTTPTTMTTEYRLLAMGGGFLSNVLTAMKNHSNDSLVQGSACVAIKNFLLAAPSSATNKTTTNDNDPTASFSIADIIQSVVHAMEQHYSNNNEELMNNACHILYHLAWHSDHEYRNIIINAVSEGKKGGRAYHLKLSLSRRSTAHHYIIF